MKYLITFLFCLNILAMYGQKPFFLQKEETIPFLYKDCVNDLWLYTPNLCEDLPFDVKVSADADIWQDSIDKRHIKIVPRGGNTIIELYHYDGNGKIVFSNTTLRVLETPSITYHFEIDGRWASGENRTIDKNSKITFTPLPDADFVNKLPNESDYRVDSIVIYILPPNNHPPQYITKIGFDIHKRQGPIHIPLPEACFVYGSGTQIYLQVGEIYRMNGQGKLIYEYFRCTLYERIGVFYVK